ncbi:hypothetical protein DOTSEDRAFT_74638 [Dothistroma septosporum NZE10]|uniref:Uncharacterized protein n=1 Tax=Dothistroma septosporum (strain NZE10 / CBS 128990) TaxID=675120 RepID=N1PC80_DOTSN|nr:hypothetical protein DOTSEDRAFT_74638 [Dothistroma septosporum NZE10]
MGCRNALVSNLRVYVVRQRTFIQSFFDIFLLAECLFKDLRRSLRSAMSGEHLQLKNPMHQMR